MPLLIDTQLLVLFVVGITSERLIPIHKRTKTYTLKQYHLLKEIIGNTREFVIVPHIIAETSNLVSQTNEHDALRLRSKLKQFADYAFESYIPSSEGFTDPSYLRLGVIDAILVISCARGATVLTADAGVYAEASSRGASVVNFWHLAAERRLV